MSTLVGLGLGAVAAVVLWRSLSDTFAAPLFARTNHRGVTVPVGAGAIISLVVIVVAAIDQVLRAFDRDLLHPGHPVVLAAVGFGLLGLLDDLAETGTAKGFAGHLRALRRGQLTTGGLKLLGGGALALAVVGPADVSEPVRLVVDAALVALAANLGNLLDRAPGRTIKTSLVVGGILLATHLDPAPAGLAVVLGAALGMLAFDLQERLMLGDAGANVLGAVIGVATVSSCSFGVRLVALAVVLILNGLSERVSFSQVIDRVPPLRALDRLGRRHH